MNIMVKEGIQFIRYCLKAKPLLKLLSLAVLISCSSNPETDPVDLYLATSPSSTIQPLSPTTTPLEASPLMSWPNFFFGVDLSYVNEMEDCGASYQINGIPQEPFAMFAGNGANLVRARLWHNPTWTNYSTLADVQKTFMRAQAADMYTLLTIHYSDEWADRGQQHIPEAWKGFDTPTELAQAVYDYTRNVLLTLHEHGVMPHFVQVGNETNGGLLKNVVRLDWPRDAQLFNAGIRAIRDVTNEVGQGPQIVLHVAQPENTGWWFREAMANGVTDFDVIGISYYPQWSRMTISQLGGQVTYLRNTFGKAVMVVETAYPWTLEAAQETADNILNQGLRSYGISPQGQRDFLVDLTQTIINNGGLGVVYWEPAWVSTTCQTRWGQGSHWENATFFDFQRHNELLPAVEFFNNPYTVPSRLVQGAIHESYGQALFTDARGDSLEQTAHLDLDTLYVSDETNYFSFALTVNGDMTAAHWGGYLIYLDTNHDQNGADVDVRNRPITVVDEHKPEFRLDIRLVEESGTSGSEFILNAWNGAAWEEIPFTGGTAVSPGSPSVIEWHLPKSLLQYPSTLWIGVVSVGRGRNHTAADILGSEPTPLDWSDEVTLSTFLRYEATMP